MIALVLTVVALVLAAVAVVQSPRSPLPWSVLLIAVVILLSRIGG